MRLFLFSVSFVTMVACRVQIEPSKDDGSYEKEIAIMLSSAPPMALGRFKSCLRQFAHVAIRPAVLKRVERMATLKDLIFIEHGSSSFIDYRAYLLMIENKNVHVDYYSSNMSDLSLKTATKFQDPSIVSEVIGALGPSTFQHIADHRVFDADCLFLSVRFNGQNKKLAAYPADLIEKYPALNILFEKIVARTPRPKDR